MKVRNEQIGLTAPTLNSSVHLVGFSVGHAIQCYEDFKFDRLAALYIHIELPEVNKNEE
jgi:hypothetical protein